MSARLALACAAVLLAACARPAASAPDAGVPAVLDGGLSDGAAFKRAHPFPNADY
jgi:hypothetical protein